ncbi:helix-turn-helix domain-containing protein [Streptomyces ardesiacus]|uniref:helix-turn-helix domain-containing protein n=1 Tax=Streptomyces ardesiacus TaxID=285564 RepID=UPI0037FACBFC
MKARGQSIRRNREESGYGLTEFARRIGISPSYLSRIERDQANPSPGVIRRIAEELHKERRAREAIAEITDTEKDGDDQPPE